MRRYLLYLLVGAVSLSGQIPDPSEFAGFPIGSDGNLVRWERIVEYFQTVASASDRVQVDELGKSTNGNPFILATVSAPKNLNRLEEIKRNQWRIAHPSELTGDEAEVLAWDSPIVVLVTCNIHATEIGSSQMVLELIHRLATESSDWVANVLDNVVFLLVPSFNPDGQIIVTDWNNRVRGTEHVWAPLPWLYHPYVGHDNNRDAVFMTQVESRYVNKILFKEWFPQVYLDEHQQGNSGMRVFVPPFRNPINPNVDPTIWAEAGQIGFAMYDALHRAGISGVGYDQKYTAWWQGGFLRGAWFHNTVGILTEVASANLASPVQQVIAELGVPPKNPSSTADWVKERNKNPKAPIPPPSDVMPRYNYPRPWLGGTWTLRNIIDAELALTYALLETSANQRVRFIENHIRMGRAAIERGTSEAPYAYVIPAKQHDSAAARHLAVLLHDAGIEIDRADSDFRADGRKFEAGSYIIRMAQPFRAYAKDLLENQDHPDPQQLPAGAMNDQPYDMTAWTLPLQMGVDAVRIDDTFQASLSRVESIAPLKGAFERLTGAAGYVVRPESNNKTRLTNRLLKAGAAVSWLSSSINVDGKKHPPGDLWIENFEQSRLAEMVIELGLEAQGLKQAPTGARLQLRQPRVALYRPHTASMDEGWTRYLLEDYEFAFTSIADADTRAGNLNSLWDAIILPGDRDNKSIASGREAPTPAEFTGGLGDEGRRALREFVSAGGTLIAMGDSTEYTLKAFELPVSNTLADIKPDEFSAPGTFLRARVDRAHPIAYGSPEEVTAVFKNNAAFEPAPGFSYTNLRVIARYPNSDLLQSGWMRGEKYLHNRIAAAEVKYHEGRIVLIGFRPQFRAQSLGTLRLLFNAIHYSAVVE